MIRKRQRNQPAPCYPTLNPAKHESIPQRLVRSRRRITDRLIAVSAAKCVEPRGGVEHRRARMPAQKFFPSRVSQRRNLVDGSQSFRPGKAQSSANIDFEPKQDWKRSQFKMRVTNRRSIPFLATAPVASQKAYRRKNQNAAYASKRTRVEAICRPQKS
jgi:hypothetical protein